MSKNEAGMVVVCGTDGLKVSVFVEMNEISHGNDWWHVRIVITRNGSTISLSETLCKPSREEAIELSRQRAVDVLDTLLCDLDRAVDAIAPDGPRCDVDKDEA